MSDTIDYTDEPDTGHWFFPDGRAIWPHHHVRDFVATEGDGFFRRRAVRPATVLECMRHSDVCRMVADSVTAELGRINWRDVP